MNEELAQSDERPTSKLKWGKIKGDYNLRRSIFGTKCRKIWAWDRTQLEWQGTSMTSQVDTTLGTNGKAQNKSSMLVCTSFSLSPLEVISWGSYLLLKHLLYDKINLVPQTWSQLHFSHVGKHKCYSLTSTQLLWDHQFRKILPKLL